MGRARDDTLDVAQQAVLCGAACDKRCVQTVEPGLASSIGGGAGAGHVPPGLRDAPRRATKLPVRTEKHRDTAQDGLVTGRPALGQRKPRQQHVDLRAHHPKLMVASLEPDLDYLQSSIRGPAFSSDSRSSALSAASSPSRRASSAAGDGPGAAASSATRAVILSISARRASPAGAGWSASASDRRSNASVSPDQSAVGKTGRPASSRQPSASVTSDTARLPLSTVDT
jgi:hypothetical protein